MIYKQGQQHCWPLFYKQSAIKIVLIFFHYEKHFGYLRCLITNNSRVFDIFIMSLLTYFKWS